MPTPAPASGLPLRPGPAAPDAAERIRERVLDAAAACLIEEGLGGRVHARIAERAGVSRPTVYKYVGDQDAIIVAIVDREFDKFVDAVLPVLRTSDDLERHLVDAVVFIVDYARGHALLQKALADHPELVLPALTTQSGPLLERSVQVFEDQLARALALAGSADLDARTVVEWLFRIIVSLITTPGSVGEGADDVRRSVRVLVRLTTLSQERV
jgi:AcrR family transcriptional regulator